MCWLFLMHIGASHDLLEGWGRGCVFNHIVEPPSIKVKCQNNSVMQYQSFFFSSEQWRSSYLRDFKVVLGLLWYTGQIFLLISCWNERTGALTELLGIKNDQWTERYFHLDLDSRRETIRETQTLFCNIEDLKTRFMFHASGLQATIQRVPIVSNFSFALLQSSLCATGDHHIKTPLFMFSPPETASSPFCPVSSKDVSSFYMIGLDLQESPPLSSCFALRVKSGESDGGSIWEIRGGGTGGVESSSQRGKWAEGFFSSLLRPC